MLKMIAPTALALILSGCQAAGEIAYDLRADQETRRCESIMSMADREACLARVQAVEKRAGEIRQSR